MHNLKDFCTEAMKPENRKFYRLGYESAMNDLQLAQTSNEEKHAIKTLIISGIVLLFLLLFSGDLFSNGFLGELIFAIMMRSGCIH